MDAQVQAAVIAALATIAAALITTAGYLYVELRRRAGRSREPVPGDRDTSAESSDDPVAGGPEAPANATRRERR